MKRCAFPAITGLEGLFLNKTLWNSKMVQYSDLSRFVCAIAELIHFSRATSTSKLGPTAAVEFRSKQSGTKRDLLLLDEHRLSHVSR